MFLDRNKRDGKFWARWRNGERCSLSCHERAGTKEKKFWVPMRWQTLCHWRRWSLQYAGCTSYELHNRPSSLWHLHGSVVERWNAESECLRFDSSWGLRIFSLSLACDKTKNIFLYNSVSFLRIHIQYVYWFT